jgi:diaminopimelate decarboxylase
MLNFYNQLKEEKGITFSVLNLGGGFGIWYAEGDRKFTYKDYTENTVNIIKRVKKVSAELGLDMPEIFIEPGRSLVGEAGITLYTVGNVKNIKSVKNYLAVDGGMFENPRFALYQAKYTVVPALKMKDLPTETYTIAGKCCESGDIIAENCTLPKMQKGDVLAVLSTGAYNYSMSSNYNRNLIPPVVFVKDGEHRLVVKGQTYEDLIRNDI